MGMSSDSVSASYLVIGHFGYVDDVQGALRRLREKNVLDFQLFSPIPNHELEEEIYQDRPRSPVRRWTLFGAITGCLSAFLMTCWMSLDWPLRTSAKTILSFPAFVIIGFECTILLGVLFTLLAVFFYCRLPNFFSFVGYKPEFSNATFGLTAKVTKEQSEVIKRDFESCGAKEVEVRYVR